MKLDSNEVITSRGKKQTAGEIVKKKKRKKDEFGRDAARSRLHRQDYLRQRAFLSPFFFFPASIQQIGKLIRLRLVHADKRLDGYTIEIKRITRSTDRGVGPLPVSLLFPEPGCN